MAVTGAEDPRRPVVPAERRRLILEMLRAQGSVSVGAAEEGFGVSPMTARRDLAILADNGYARRTHGGAVLPELAGHEDSFQSRLEQGVEVKVRLARAVAETLNPHETVFVDSSSSAYYIVREIVESGMPRSLASAPVRSDVGTPVILRPDATRSPSTSTKAVAVEPVPSPSLMPFSTKSIARWAAADLAASWSNGSGAMALSVEVARGRDEARDGGVGKLRSN